MLKRILSVGLALAILLTGWLAFSDREASACSCAAMGASERLEKYAAVFVGEVVDKGGTKKGRHGKVREYTFEVKEAWKGVEESPFTIYAYDGASASCGYSFEKGQSYLVYSYQEKDGTLQTNLCSGNSPVEQADDDIKQLSMGTTSVRPEEGITVTSRENDLSPYAVVGMLVLLLGAAGALLWWRRRNSF